MAAALQNKIETRSPFQTIPSTANGHFRLNFYAAVYALVRYLYMLGIGDESDPASLYQQFRFLKGYVDELTPFLPARPGFQTSIQWWLTMIALWEKDIDVHLPLRELSSVGIDERSRLALMLSCLVEEDSRFGSLFADMQFPLSNRRPTIETIARIVTETGDADLWDGGQNLLDHHLLDPINRDSARSEWLVRVPAVLWEAIRGTGRGGLKSWGRYYVAPEEARLQDIILPSAFHEQLERLPGLLAASQVDTVVLRGSQGSDRFKVMCGLAAELGWDVLMVTADDEHQQVPWEHIGPYCTLMRTMPVITYDLGPGETTPLPILSSYDGPKGVIMGQEGGLRGQAAERVIHLNMPLLRSEHRKRIWAAAFKGHAVPDLVEIGDRYHLPARYIRQAAQSAIGLAQLQGRTHITPADVQKACRALNRQELDTLATYLDTSEDWDRLVASDMMAARLWELEQRCRYRESLLDHLAPTFDSAPNHGVRALFTGPSGTGKTLAARTLAGSLGMDLYRVDLAAVVNKYIGETEKNLHRMLSRAEELDVILLLDEGDALLGSRTEVKSANDRYANLETNYLLQRLETYQGIVIVTTNRGDNIDSAFQRRMDVVVLFGSPEAGERWRLWLLHLPPDHGVDMEFLEEVASRCALTGGQIRNAALNATMLALDDGRAIDGGHLREAISTEYRKAGAVCPLDTPESTSYDRDEDIELFLNLLPD